LKCPDLLSQEHQGENDFLPIGQLRQHPGCKGYELSEISRDAHARQIRHSPAQSEALKEGNGRIEIAIGNETIVQKPIITWVCRRR
jgi:hypothetical protein